MINIFTCHFELIDRKASFTGKLQLWETWAGLDPACQDTMLGHQLQPQDGGQTFREWLLASSFPDAANPSLNGVHGTLGCRLLR